MVVLLPLVMVLVQQKPARLPTAIRLKQKQ